MPKKHTQVKKTPKGPAGPTKGGGSNEMKSCFAPIAKQKKIRTGTPKVTSTWYTTKVRHREFLGDVVGSSVFTVTQYPLNPGLAGSFPWLSAIAKFYESYKIESLKFYYETSRATTTNGKIYLAVDFDAAEGPPTSKQNMMSMQSATSGPVWTEVCYNALHTNLKKFTAERFVRDAILPYNKDVKTYDVGSLLVATSGCSDFSPIGEIYVEYEITLLTPNVAVTNPQPGTNISPMSYGETIVSPMVGLAPNLIMGPTGFNQSNGDDLATANNNVLTFNQAGDFLIEISTALVSNLIGAVGSTCALVLQPTFGASNFWSFVVTALFGQVLNLQYTGAGGNVVNRINVEHIPTIDLPAVIARQKKRNANSSAVGTSSLIKLDEDCFKKPSLSTNC